MRRQTGGCSLLACLTQVLQHTGAGGSTAGYAFGAHVVPIIFNLRDGSADQLLVAQLCVPKFCVFWVVIGCKCS